MAEIIAANATAAKRPAAHNNGVSITDILLRTLHFWPWILLSLAVFTGAAVFYLLRTPNVYTTTASMLIKDQSAGKTAGEDFGSYGLFQSKSNIQNEITTMKSIDIMEEVVRRLDLDINYFLPGRFHDRVAYGTGLPARVALPGFPEQSAASMRLTVSADSTATISHLHSADIDDEQSYTARLGDTIATAIGQVVVTAGPAFPAPGTKDVQLKVSKMPVSAAAGSYEGRFAVSRNEKKGTVVDLTITDRSTQRAQDVLNTLIAVYNEYWIRDKNMIAVSTSNFIKDRLGVIENELGNVDSDISSYKSQHLIPNVEAASSMYMSQNQQIAQEILSLNNQLQMTRYIRSYLIDDGKRDQLLPSNSGISNADVNSLIAEYNDKILQRNALIAKSSEKNPLVAALDEQLSAQRSAIVASVDNAIIGLNTQIKNLQGSQAATTSKIASNPSQAKYLLSVERQQKVKESLYLFLLQKREENELSQAFTAYNTRIVNRPSSYGPTAPNRSMILMVAIAVGLLLPFVVVYLLEMNNTKVRGRKDVEGLSLPFLGEIPTNAAKNAAGKATPANAGNRILVTSGSRDTINEAFRVLRTNVEFMRNHDRAGANVVVMTSFNPGSGKSFITMNLAAALAIKGRRVLVIDGDMRHGSASDYVGSPRQGLAAYLSGAITSSKSIIFPVADNEGLKVLPVGIMPPNPAELLESPRFTALIDELRSEFDYILIDCPPVEVVADTQIIDQVADRTIFVVRAGLLERAMLDELEKFYAEKKYHNMAFILNGTVTGNGLHGYTYSYGYGYAQGYDYGNAQE